MGVFESLLSISLWAISQPAHFYVACLSFRTQNSGVCLTRIKVIDIYLDALEKTKLCVRAEQLSRADDATSVRIARKFYSVRILLRLRRLLGLNFSLLKREKHERYYFVKSS